MPYGEESTKTVSFTEPSATFNQYKQLKCEQKGCHLPGSYPRLNRKSVFQLLFLPVQNKACLWCR